MKAFLLTIALFVTSFSFAQQKASEIDWFFIPNDSILIDAEPTKLNFEGINQLQFYHGYLMFIHQTGEEPVYIAGMSKDFSIKNDTCKFWINNVRNNTKPKYEVTFHENPKGTINVELTSSTEKNLFFKAHTITPEELKKIKALHDE